MTNMRKSLVFILSSLILAACGGDEGVGLSIRAASSGAGLGLADEGGTTYALQSAQVHLRHIELDLPAGTTCADLEGELAGAACLSDAKIRIDGPMVVDLITGATTPDLGKVALPAGTYSRIDFRVDDGDPQEGLIQAGDALDDYSLVVDATFDYEGTPVTLLLSLNFDEDIRIERPAGVALAPADNLAVKFVVDDWLAGVDIAGCLDDGELTLDGDTVVIDDLADGACGGVEDIIKNNMKNSGDLD